MSNLCAFSRVITIPVQDAGRHWSFLRVRLPEANRVPSRPPCEWICPAPLHVRQQYADAESGHYYLRARYYDPISSQFISRDPAVTSTREAYGYAGDSPLNGSDPTGLDFWSTLQSAQMWRPSSPRIGRACHRSDPAHRWRSDLPVVTGVLADRLKLTAV